MQVCILEQGYSAIPVAALIYPPPSLVLPPLFTMQVLAKLDNLKVQVEVGQTFNIFPPPFLSALYPYS
jgi:hypothetical protein